MIKKRLYVSLMMFLLLLTACGGGGSNDEDKENEKPVDVLDANLNPSAGYDVSTTLNAIVQLDVIKSTDALARQIEYQWEIFLIPEQSAVIIRKGART